MHSVRAPGYSLLVGLIVCGILAALIAADRAGELADCSGSPETSPLANSQGFALRLGVGASQASAIPRKKLDTTVSRLEG